MPEEVLIREDLQVIQVNSRGDITTVDFNRTLEDLLRIQQDQGLNKVFVDATRVISYPSTFSIFEFGSEAAKALKDIQFAISVLPGQRSNTEFFETVMRNRGARVSILDSPDDALAWLRNC